MAAEVEETRKQNFNNNTIIIIIVKHVYMTGFVKMCIVHISNF